MEAEKWLGLRAGGEVKRGATYMEFARSAQAAKASTSERTSVLSQSRRRVVICVL